MKEIGKAVKKGAAWTLTGRGVVFGIGFVASVETATGPRNEVHYSLFWTKWGLASDVTCTPSGSPGSALDDPRQLGYSDPPDNTVVTWNTYFRETDGTGQVQRLNRDVVLFLGGSAKVFDSRDLSERSWRILP